MKLAISLVALLALSLTNISMSAQSNNSTTVNTLKKVPTVDKTELNSSINNAKALYDGLKDEYATIATTLKSAIDIAQQVADNDAATQEAVDAAKSTLDSAIATAQEARQSADQAKVGKEVFEKRKIAYLQEVATLAKEDDSEACQKLIAEAQKAIKNAVYDESKSLEDNSATLQTMVENLATALETQRLAEKNTTKLMSVKANSNAKCAKIIKNGQLYIITPNGKTFDILGHEIK